MLSAEPQREALSKGGQILSVPFLASPAVQRELDAIVSKALLNNSDIERKHFHDKASERGQPKIRSLSRLSRTQDLKFAALERSVSIPQEKFINLRVRAVQSTAWSTEVAGESARS